MIITKEELEKKIEEGMSLTEIAGELRVSTGYISRLCNQFEITPPPPGRRPGDKLSEEHKHKISESQRKRIEGRQ